MNRRLLVVLMVTGLVVACSGTPMELFDSRHTGVVIDLDETAVDGSAGMRGFDPAGHSLEISIIISPGDHPDNLDVVLVSGSGTRYQVLGSFAQCVSEDSVRRCERSLGPLPLELDGDWRVDVIRRVTPIPATVDVQVNWVPITG